MFVVRLVTAVLLLAIATTAWPLPHCHRSGNGTKRRLWNNAQPMTLQCCLSASQIENN
jgi:hypothetical protein